MRKMLLGAVALSLVFVLSACNKKPAKKTSAPQPPEQNVEINSDMKKAEVEEGVKEMQELMKKNEPVHCTYTVNSEGVESKHEVFIDGEKYKSVSTSPEEVFEAIFDGQAHYAWATNQKQGTKMDVKCMEEFSDEGQEEVDVDDVDVDFDTYKTTEEILNQDVEMKCEKAKAIDFSIPTNVEFVDQCEMLKKQMKMMENVQNSMPEDVMKQMQDMPEVPDMPAMQ